MKSQKGPVSYHAYCRFLCYLNFNDNPSKYEIKKKMLNSLFLIMAVMIWSDSRANGVIDQTG